MKYSFSSRLFGIVIIVLSSAAIANRPLMAQIMAQTKNSKYYCGEAYYQGKKVPATVSNTTRGENIPLIYWVSSWSGLNPRQRCEDVSGRLQAAYDNNLLKRKYLTTGKLNDNPVICIRVEKGKDCEVILTLKPGDDAEAILEQMLDFRGRLSGKRLRLTDDLVFYDNGNTYVDIDLFLEKAVEP